MYTSKDYEMDSLKKSIGIGYLRLAFEAILHATFFPAYNHESRKNSFKKKYKFLKENRLFDIACDLINQRQKNFDKEVFRKDCLAKLEKNYLSKYENSRYIKRNLDKSNMVSKNIKTTS